MDEKRISLVSMYRRGNIVRRPLGTLKNIRKISHLSFLAVHYYYILLAVPMEA